MRLRRLLHEVVGVVVAGFLVSCASAGDGDDVDGSKDTNDDINAALAALPDAVVLERTQDGVPMYIVGEMAKVGDAQMDDLAATEVALRPALAPVLATMRLRPEDMRLLKINVDENGDRHLRYQQTYAGMDVIGGDVVIHVDVKGAVVGINGFARGDLPGTAPRYNASQAADRVSADPRFAGMSLNTPRQVFLITQTSERFRAYEFLAEGTRGPDPVADRVYVDGLTGAIVAVYPKIHFAKNRRVYTANNGTSIPGTLRRSEGQAATGDLDVDKAYDNTGASYDSYNNFWSRDSYNNAGATLTSSVHYSTNYCNAFWNGTQMVYGDGNAAQNCLPLARSVDVTAHELTHAVTENESGLVYSGESGGMNEAMSDIFGAFTEAFVDGGGTGTLAVSSDTWLVGEEILPPYLRKMNDPAADGASADAWYSGVGNLDVHYSSGVGNLALYLLSQGGTHPRGKTNVQVPGIGFDKAIRILYKAQIDILTSNSQYANVRTAMEQAASQLGYDQATQDAVGCAWAAVAVGTAPANCGGPPPPPPPGDGVLQNGVPVTGIGDTTVGNMKFWKLDVPSGQTTLTFQISGGSGDADMYVNFGTKPTTTSYQCRPYINGNNETCTFSPPQAGTYWVGLRAYTTYSGVTLKGTYSTGGGGGDPYLTNGVPVTGISGATSSNKYWRVTVPSGRTVTIRISGGTGDADLYTRFGSRPTLTTYACRPYLNGNNETCTHTTTSAGDWYVRLRGYTSYSGVSLVASF